MEQEGKKNQKKKLSKLEKIENLEKKTKKAKKKAKKRKLKLKKTKKKKVSKQRKLIDRKLEKIMVSAKNLPLKDRKLFSDAVLTLGVAGIISLMTMLLNQHSILENPEEFLKPITFIYFMIGLMQYFRNKNHFKNYKNYYKLQIEKMGSIHAILEGNNNEMQEVLYNIQKARKQVFRIQKDVTYTLNSKVNMLSKF